MMTVSDQEIVEAYKTLVIREIAKKFKRSSKTIIKILRENNIIMRPASMRVTISTEELIRLYNLGLSANQVGKLTKLRGNTVIHRLKSVGFPLRDRKTAKSIEYTTAEFEMFFLNMNISL